MMKIGAQCIWMTAGPLTEWRFHTRNSLVDKSSHVRSVRRPSGRVARPSRALAPACFLLSLIVLATVTPRVTEGDPPFVNGGTVNDVTLGVQAGVSIARWVDGRFAVVWHDSRNEGVGFRNYDIYFRTLGPSGVAEAASIRVNDDATTRDQTFPVVAVDSFGYVHVAWVDVRNGVSQIYYARSRNGITFEANVGVNQSTGTQIHPAIATDREGDPHVAWADLRGGDSDVYYAESSDGGTSFGSAVRLDDDQSDAIQANPTISINATNGAWVAWTDYRNDQDGRFFDGGGSDGFNDADVYLAGLGGDWFPNVRVDDDLGRTSQGVPEIAHALDGTLIIAWLDFRNDADGYPVDDWITEGGVDGVNRAEIFIRMLEPGGSFTPTVQVNDNLVASERAHPTMAVDGERLHVAWADERNNRTNSDIYYTSAALPLGAFARNLRVNDDLPTASRAAPALAAGSSVVVIAWAEWREDSETDVFTAVLTPAGVEAPTPGGVDGSVFAGVAVIIAASVLVVASGVVVRRRGRHDDKP